MVDTKTQRNKSDKETIIDMEPVKEQQKISFFKTNNFVLPLISVLFFVLISTWLILDYLPNFFQEHTNKINDLANTCLLYTSPSPRDGLLSRMPSSA